MCECHVEVQECLGRVALRPDDSTWNFGCADECWRSVQEDAPPPNGLDRAEFVHCL